MHQWHSFYIRQMMVGLYTRTSRKIVSRKAGLPASNSIRYLKGQVQSRSLITSLALLNNLDNWPCYCAGFFMSGEGSLLANFHSSFFQIEGQLLN